MTLRQRHDPQPIDDQIELRAVRPIGVVPKFFDEVRSRWIDFIHQAFLFSGVSQQACTKPTVTFATKCADALGTLIAGILLSLIAFPTETAVGDVPPGIIAKLGLIYGPVVFLIWMGVILPISRYGISRSRHREMLERLAGDWGSSLKR
jgi:hypothetical protein